MEISPFFNQNGFRFDYKKRRAAQNKTELNYITVRGFPLNNHIISFIPY